MTKIKWQDVSTNRLKLSEFMALSLAEVDGIKWRENCAPNEAMVNFVNSEGNTILTCGVGSARAMWVRKHVEP